MKRIVVIWLAVVIMLIPLMGVGCDSGGDNGNGDGNENGVSTISGELVGMWEFTTTWGTDPGTGTPYPTETFSGFTPLIEDEDGKLILLSAPADSHFEYDGYALIEVKITIAGYTYSHYAPFDYEYIDVGFGEKQITYTGIQVAVTGTIDTVTTDSFSGDEIDVETIEELS